MQNNSFSSLEGHSILYFQSSITFLLWLTTEEIQFINIPLGPKNLYWGEESMEKTTPFFSLVLSNRYPSSAQAHF